MTNLMSDRARRLRQDLTSAERKLWKGLRLLNQDGYHFRRQAPIGPYIADFAELRALLIIECDGDDHAEAAAVVRDTRRDAWFENQGFRVMRFSNHVVRANLDDVMHAIVVQLGMRPYDNLSAAEVTATRVQKSAIGIPPLPGPPPQGGRESPGPVRVRKRRQRATPHPRSTPTNEAAPSPVAPRALRHDVGEGWGGGDSVPSVLGTDSRDGRTNEQDT